MEGMEYLTPRTRPELQYAKLNKLRDDERRTCQVHLSGGDIAVKVPKETQLPHLTYSE